VSGPSIPANWNGRTELLQVHEQCFAGASSVLLQAREQCVQVRGSFAAAQGHACSFHWPGIVIPAVWNGGNGMDF